MNRLHILGTSKMYCGLKAGATYIGRMYDIDAGIDSRTHPLHIIDASSV